jgi:hypothetical protein
MENTKNDTQDKFIPNCNYYARECFFREAYQLERCEASLGAEREILHFMQSDRLSSYNDLFVWLNTQ